LLWIFSERLGFGDTEGKTSLARVAAELAGQDLVEVALTSSTDTSDLLGGFEQVSANGRRALAIKRNIYRRRLGDACDGQDTAEYKDFLDHDRSSLVDGKLLP